MHREENSRWNGHGSNPRGRLGTSANSKPTGAGSHVSSAMIQVLTCYCSDARPSSHSDRLGQARMFFASWRTFATRVLTLDPVDARQPGLRPRNLICFVRSTIFATFSSMSQDMQWSQERWCRQQILWSDCIPRRESPSRPPRSLTHQEKHTRVGGAMAKSRPSSASTLLVHHP